MMLKVHRTSAPVVDGLEIVPAHPQREWMNATPLPPNKDGSVTKGTGFANRCLPLLMANQLGWNICTKVPYVITTLENGMHITHHPTGRPPRLGAPQNNFMNSLITWPVPWNFETPKGWDLLIMPPANVIQPRGVTILSALVETDHTPATFTINWHLEPKTTVFIEAGQPLVQVVPFPTDQFDGWGFQEDDELPEGYARWWKRRRESTDRMNENFGRWDKDYWNEAKRRKIKKAAPGECPVNHGGNDEQAP